MKIELKPCPFCGGYAHLDKAYSYFRDTVICCEECDSVFTLDDLDKSAEEIVEAWNRRVTMRTPEEIKKGLEACRKGARCTMCPYLKDEIVQCSDNLKADIAAYIQQLEAQIPRWISVDDELPNSNRDVLVYAQDRTDKPNIVVISSRSRYNNAFSTDGWLEPWQYFGAHYKITHWMELPEAPKRMTNETD